LIVHSTIIVPKILAEYSVTGADLENAPRLQRKVLQVNIEAEKISSEGVSQMKRPAVSRFDI
jgi:hypothetical protein